MGIKKTWKIVSYKSCLHRKTLQAICVSLMLLLDLNNCGFQVDQVWQQLWPRKGLQVHNKAFKSGSQSEKMVCFSELVESLYSSVETCSHNCVRYFENPNWSGYTMYILLYNRLKINCWEQEELGAVMWGTRYGQLNVHLRSSTVRQSFLFVFSKVWLQGNVEHFLNPWGIKEMCI